MNDRQLNTTKMWSAEDAVLSRYESVWKSRAPFKKGVDRLWAAIAALEDPAMKQQKTTTGITEDKASLELAAAYKADYIGNIMQAYALDQNNMELYNDMEFNAYTIIDMREDAAYTKMKAVATQARELKDELEDFGLDKKDLDALDQLLSDYAKKKDAPRDAAVQRSSATQSIADIIKEGNTALHFLDKLIATFADISPDFVREYKAARIIIDAGHGPRPAASQQPGA